MLDKLLEKLAPALEGARSSAAQEPTTMVITGGSARGDSSDVIPYKHKLSYTQRSAP